MNILLIQPLLFPPAYLIKEPKLFFSSKDSQIIQEDKLIIPSGAEVSFETYFNAFSIGKWLEYTKLDNLTLHLEIQGNVEIKAYHAVGFVNEDLLNKGKGKLSDDEYLQKVNTQGYRVNRKETPCTITQEGDNYYVKFNQLYDEGILYVTIKAITDSILYRGGYETEYNESSLNTIKIAIGICTFLREDFVAENVNHILSDIIANHKSSLAEKCEVYITDNGQTIDINLFKNDKIHIYPSPDLGASGGFARAMIEAMIYDKAKSFTHIILMDDDILLYPAVLERTYYLLMMLKEKYQKSTIGGSQFLLDRKSVQYENGALYRDTTTYIGRSNHKYFDMRYPGSVSSNEVINEVNYTGWWFACIPREIVTDNNLPMPFFIHYDDAEYGVRNIDNGLIFLNGICVWHPAPVNKGPFWITYYNVRNRLITMFSRGIGMKNFIKYIMAISKMFLFHITRYEYKRAALIQKGMKDFLKGSAAFIETDALGLHEALLGNKITYIAPEKAGVRRNTIVSCHHKNFLMAGLTQLFCNLLPAKDKVLAVDGKYYNIPYRARKLYIYDDKIDKGYILERNQKAFFKLLFSYIMTVWKLFWRYNGLLHDWQEAKQTLTSLHFWEKYLGLNKN